MKKVTNIILKFIRICGLLCILLTTYSNAHFGTATSIAWNKLQPNTELGPMADYMVTLPALRTILLQGAQLRDISTYYKEYTLMEPLDPESIALIEKWETSGYYPEYTLMNDFNELLVADDKESAVRIVATIEEKNLNVFKELFPWAQVELMGHLAIVGFLIQGMYMWFPRKKKVE